MSALRSSDRRGLTLIEMLIAMVVFGVVVGAALTTLRSQSRAYRLGSERMAALQNVRFATRVLDMDVRTAGSGVPDYQPYLVYAGNDVIAFNANYVTNLADDPFAVYYDPDAPTGTVAALTLAQRFTLPATAFAYPDSSYADASGTNSQAETIVFFFTPDSATTRSDDYALFRKVNRDPPELVARHLLRTGGTDFFEYLRVRQPASGPAQLLQVDSLPLMHSAAFHMAQDDTGSASVIDSVRAVRVNITGTNGLTGADERRRSVSRLVRMPNAGLATRRSCGDEPLLGTALTAAAVTLPSGDPAVRLTWSQATDEAGGESDVVRYVLWRRVGAAPDWGDPYLSIPAGVASYAYEDAAVASGSTYRYALAAQDCTPNLSALATSSAVTVP